MPLQVGADACGLRTLQLVAGCGQCGEEMVLNWSRACFGAPTRPQHVWPNNKNKHPGVELVPQCEDFNEEHVALPRHTVRGNPIPRPPSFLLPSPFLLSFSHSLSLCSPKFSHWFCSYHALSYFHKVHSKLKLLCLYSLHFLFYYTSTIVPVLTGEIFRPCLLLTPFTCTSLPQLTQRP